MNANLKYFSLYVAFSAMICMGESFNFVEKYFLLRIFWDLQVAKLINLMRFAVWGTTKNINYWIYYMKI